MIRRLFSSILPCEPIAAWHLLRDFGDLAAWHPAVETCAHDHEQCVQSRVVAMRDGLSFAEVLDETSERHRRQVLRIVRAPFPARMLKQTLTVHDVTASGGALLCWELHADLPEEWHARAQDWFCDGYIKAGMRGLSAHLSAQRNEH